MGQADPPSAVVRQRIGPRQHGQRGVGQIDLGGLRLAAKGADAVADAQGKVDPN